VYKTIQKTIQDLLSPMVLKFILKIGLGSIAFWVGVLWYFWGSFEHFILSYLTWIPWTWAKEIIAYIAAPFTGYMLIIITISTLTSLYSEDLLIALAKKHYPKQQIVGKSLYARFGYGNSTFDTSFCGVDGGAFSFASCSFFRTSGYALYLVNFA